jgi:hypothetical protein
MLRQGACEPKHFSHGVQLLTIRREDYEVRFFPSRGVGVSLQSRLLTDRFRGRLDQGHTLAVKDATELLRLDYAKMRAQMAPLREELLRYVMHPSKVKQLEIFCS